MATANADQGKPRSHRRQATRDRLLAAAGEVFAERGFHGASVEDICERAGFTRGAFYSNFTDKDELVTELYAQHSRRLRTAVTEVASRPGLTLPDLLDAVVDVWAGDPEERRRWHLLTTEFGLHALRDEQARRAWAAIQADVRSGLAEVVDGIVRSHDLHPTVSTDRFVRLVTMVLQGGLAQHLLEPDQVGPGELEREFLPLVTAAATEGAGAARGGRPGR